MAGDVMAAIGGDVDGLGKLFYVSGFLNFLMLLRVTFFGLVQMFDD